MKKELAELRANQAVAEPQGADMAMIDAHISRTRGIDPQSRAEADVERSAHRETLESLEQSESTVSPYFSKLICLPCGQCLALMYNLVS